MRIGIDLGGTKISGLALSPDGIIHDWVRRATPRGSYSGTISVVAELVDHLEGLIGRRACIETFLSGPALAADDARHGGEAGIDAQDVAARAADGDDSGARGAAWLWSATAAGTALADDERDG